MAELADALDSGSSEDFLHAGSSPVSRTSRRDGFHIHRDDFLRKIIALPFHHRSSRFKAGFEAGGRGTKGRRNGNKTARAAMSVLGMNLNAFNINCNFNIKFPSWTLLYH